MNDVLVRKDDLLLVGDDPLIHKIVLIAPDGETEPLFAVITHRVSDGFYLAQGLCLDCGDPVGWSRIIDLPLLAEENALIFDSFEVYRGYMDSLPGEDTPGAEPHGHAVH